MREIAGWTLASALFALLVWEGVKILRARRASRAAGNESPKLFLKVVRGAAVMMGGFFLELLIKNRRDVFTDADSGIVAIFCLALSVLFAGFYFLVRHREGTGDQPKDEESK